ncbi:DUF2797 domain-containing protein [Pseudomonadota bacterium]
MSASSDVVVGNLRKMVTSLESPVKYQLLLCNEQGDHHVDMNAHIGHSIRLNYCGEINCVHCGRKTKKSFGQGHCYPCFRDLPQCDGCIMKPETCHFDAGTCRDPEWGQANCFQDHYVYLANSSGVKVGITRGTQIPTRWMDQGATQALPIFRVNNRLQSGLVEVALKKHVADKTDWRKMLKGIANPVELQEARETLVAQCSEELDEIRARCGDDAISYLPDEALVDIAFPVNEYPEKVKSFNFDKTPQIDGILNGIKGQYLILDTGVINIRKFGGYRVEFSSEA